MGKLTISMAIFNSYVKLPEGIGYWNHLPGPPMAAMAGSLGVPGTASQFFWMSTSWLALFTVRPFTSASMVGMTSPWVSTMVYDGMAKWRNSDLWMICLMTKNNGNVTRSCWVALDLTMYGKKSWWSFTDYNERVLTGDSNPTLFWWSESLNQSGTSKAVAPCLLTKFQDVALVLPKSCCDPTEFCRRGRFIFYHHGYYRELYL